MRGAILGDIIGSVHEHSGTKTTDFPLFQARYRFTDDTVMTVAVADCLMNGKDPAAALRSWGRRFPKAGYGGMFSRWLEDDRLGDYGSWGNGGPMRVSPCAYLADSLPAALDAARRVTCVTHSHPEAVKGSEAVVTAIFLGRQGSAVDEIRRIIESRFGYDLSRPIADLRASYTFDVSSAGTVPPALSAAFEADSSEQAIRLAISLGGDADTLACIAGAVAEPLYGIPEEFWRDAEDRLPPSIRAVLNQFYERVVVVGRPVLA